jgi:hypothetical protein
MTVAHPFKPGDRVRRRRGMLGEDGPPGVVTDLLERGGHELVRVRFPDHVETFVWSEYEKAA